MAGARTAPNWPLILGILSILAGGSAVAQGPAGSAPAPAQPPAPGIPASPSLPTLPGLTAVQPPQQAMRLSYVAGNVGLLPAGTQAWVQAELNRPLTTGDTLWTAPGARAELHLGTAAVRLAADTLLRLEAVDADRLSLSLWQGSAALHWHALAEPLQLDCQTPQGQVRPQRPGHLRLSIGAVGDADRLVLMGGSAEAQAQGEAPALVMAGQQMRLGPPSSGALATQPAGDEDGFDAWCRARAERERAPTSLQHLSRAIVGYEELDAAGRWQADPTYGTLWLPSQVPAAWAPYRRGRWAPIRPWGWTWIDRAAWGYAPSHYGRWAETEAGWGWAPGRKVERPTYAPALVSFMATAAVVGAVTQALGPQLGYFPLGPQMPFTPGYPASSAYLAGINPGGAALAAAPSSASAISYLPQALLAAAALGMGVNAGGAPALPQALQPPRPPPPSWPRLPQGMPARHPRGAGMPTSLQRHQAPTPPRLTPGAPAEGAGIPRRH